VSFTKKQYHHHRLRATGATTATSTSTSNSIDCDVAIYGGGFGGLYAAIALANSNPQLDIVLVEPAASFVFLPLLYDLTIGTATEREVCPTYSDLLATTKNIRQVRASLSAMTVTTATANGPPPKTPPVAVCSSHDGNMDNDITIRPRQAAILAVGASPAAILGTIPGATELARPFYTKADADRTRDFLTTMEEEMLVSDSSSNSKTTPRRIAVVGGGYGGVELAACLQRRWNNNNNNNKATADRAVQVTLLSRGAPLGGTRAAALVEQALTKLGVTIENVAVEALLRQQSVPGSGDGPIRVVRTAYNDATGTAVSQPVVDDTMPFDAVFWTAGSKPALPDSLTGLQRTVSGRVAIRPNLQCVRENGTVIRGLWAVGDCAEVVVTGNNNSNAAWPKTASVALQQGMAVAQNIQTVLKGGYPEPFEFRELGSMFTLGGPNAAILAPKSGPLAPFLSPLLDVADEALSRVDQALQQSTLSDGLRPGSTPIISFGSHGLGATDESSTSSSSTGVLAGTVSGAIRRTVYAALMPTNAQRVIALLSASTATIASLVQEVVADQKKQ
jgi:demethylphylloquinone reductase